MKITSKTKGIKKESYRYVYEGSIETDECLEIDLDMCLYVTGSITADGSITTDESITAGWYITAVGRAVENWQEIYNRQEGVRKLRMGIMDIKREHDGDEEVIHYKIDKLIVEFIDDEKLTRMFKEDGWGWYA